MSHVDSKLERHLPRSWSFLNIQSLAAGQIRSLTHRPWLCLLLCDDITYLYMSSLLLSVIACLHRFICDLHDGISAACVWRSAVQYYILDWAVPHQDPRSNREIICDVCAFSSHVVRADDNVAVYCTITREGRRERQSCHDSF